jgi:4-diphosphocytidyl-2-C-methyl-D-erythritol kinase
VLHGLNRLWNLNASPEQLDALAAGMGSDINFFLRHSAALCRGRGEQVEPIPCRLSASILLINPGFGISTKWAYASWAKATAAGPANPPDVTILRQALANDDLPGVSRALFNSLEAPSVHKYPVLRLLKDALRAGGAAGALMSGSGATVFGLFADAKAAERTAQTIREQFGPSMWTQVTRVSSPATRPV